MNEVVEVETRILSLDVTVVRAPISVEAFTRPRNNHLLRSGGVCPDRLGDPAGRLLDEALPGGPVRRTPAGEAFDLTFGAFHQRIERLSSGGRAYVTCAHRINNDGWTPERGLPEGARTDDDD